MTELKTCKHIYDSGYHCSSAAAKDRDYCVYHLRYRGRGMRMAQSRARNQRFDLHLPPLEDMHAVQSALSQLAEALAADMIDLKRAHELHSVLRSAAGNFRHPEAWQTKPYTSDQSATSPVSYEEFEAEFGLPEGLNLDVPPEVAFPPPPDPALMDLSSRNAASSFSDLSSRAQAAASATGVEGPLYSPLLSREPLFPEIPPPYVRDYMAEAEAAFFETTPEQIELREIMKTEGRKAWESRALEHERNANRKRRRKHFRANYERYVAEAKLQNIQRAAEKLLKDRLAAEKAAAQKLASEQEAAQNSQPNDVVGKKPPTPADTSSFTTNELQEKEKGAQSIA